MSQDGFNSNVSFSSSLNGVQPAFYIDNGFPQDYVPPPFISADFRNGSGLMYRTLDGNERPRSQQWNLTVDREITPGFTLGLAYVGSRGRRVPSSNEPLNALDPALLSHGHHARRRVPAGHDTSLNGVPLPYAGWVEQMTSCAPTVAQALLPYPQYCSNLQGLNENYGKSSYHSLQAKVEKRFSGGTYFLVSYTLGRIYTSGSDNTQRDALTWSGASGSISPFEQDRNRALATDDVTHVLSAALVWDLPIGRDSTGATKALLGGWQLSTIFRYSSGIPFYFRSSYCNVPGQFRAACIPVDEREHLRAGLRQPRRDPADLQPGRVRVAGRLQLLLRQRRRGSPATASPATATGPLAHQEHQAVQGRQPAAPASRPSTCGTGTTGTANSTQWGGNAFNTDVNSADFGLWNGSVTSPRVIQLAARLEF